MNCSRLYIEGCKNGYICELLDWDDVAQTWRSRSVQRLVFQDVECLLDYVRDVVHTNQTPGLANS